MSLPRHAKTRDLNEAAIVRQLRTHPAVRLVYLMDQPCDLLVQLVGGGGTWHLLEIKNPEHGPARRRRQTRAQREFWEQAAPAPRIVTSYAEAVEALGLAGGERLLPPG